MALMLMRSGGAGDERAARALYAQRRYAEECSSVTGHCCRLMLIIDADAAILSPATFCHYRAMLCCRAECFALMSFSHARYASIAARGAMPVLRFTPLHFAAIWLIWRYA